MRHSWGVSESATESIFDSMSLFLWQCTVIQFLSLSLARISQLCHAIQPLSCLRNAFNVYLRGKLLLDCVRIQNLPACLLLSTNSDILFKNTVDNHIIHNHKSIHMML